MNLTEFSTTYLVNCLIHARNLTTKDREAITKELKKRGAIIG